MNIFSYIISMPSPHLTQYAFLFFRIAIGILTLFHGLPKIMGGMQTWHNVGSVMNIFGIYFLPVMWGCIAACTEFFGGILLIFGFGTRIAAFFNIIMMMVALTMHLHTKDTYPVYSFALTMIVVFIFFLIMGSGVHSVDYWLGTK